MGSERHDTVVIGGGQAGLAAGYALARRAQDFVTLEAAPHRIAPRRELVVAP